MFLPSFGFSPLLWRAKQTQRKPPRSHDRSLGATVYSFLSIVQGFRSVLLKRSTTANANVDELDLHFEPLPRVKHKPCVPVTDKPMQKQRPLHCCHLVGKNLHFWHVLLLINETYLSFLFPVSVPMLGGDPDVPWTCCVKIASFNICCALQVNALK